MRFTLTRLVPLPLLLTLPEEAIYIAPYFPGLLASQLSLACACVRSGMATGIYFLFSPGSASAANCLLHFSRQSMIAGWSGRSV